MARYGTVRNKMWVGRYGTVPYATRVQVRNIYRWYSTSENGMHIYINIAVYLGCPLDLVCHNDGTFTHILRYLTTQFSHKF